MRAARWLAMAVVAGSLMGAGRAQERGLLDSALEHGPLVVWWVARATATDKAIVTGRKLAATAGPPMKSVEKTMGEFGESSSNVGQTAASYGQTASSLGKSASDTGQTAGSTGETAGSFGRTSSSVGQTAGSYGQSASSLGQSAGSYGESIAQASVPLPLPGQMKSPAVVNLPRVRLVDALRASYPGIEVRVLDVLDVELREKLDRAQGSVEYPDVVVGVENLPWWKGSGLGLTMLGVPSMLEAIGPGTDQSTEFTARFATILRQAPHMAAAKAFVVWVRDAGACGGCDGSAVGDREAVAKAAEGAVTRVMGGGSLGGDADPAAAGFDGGKAQWAALGWSRGLAPGEIEGVSAEMKVMAAMVAGPLAVVSVRAVLSGENSFGVTHSLVVLRRSGGGGWRVLQVSPNIWVGQVREAEDLLAAALVKRPGDARVQGVSLAAPVDRERRQAEPELWWDNHGRASLEAVEWQVELGGAWSASSLQLVPEVDARLHTRVVARFAQMAGLYRWRVWAVGGGGGLVLSDWRTFVVAGR